jgi:hypothetical protein
MKIVFHIMNMKEIGELVSEIINRIKLYENRISYYEQARQTKQQVDLLDKHDPR